jgi:hypothetical protein
MGFVGKLRMENGLTRKKYYREGRKFHANIHDNLTSMQDMPKDLQLSVKLAHPHHHHHRQNYATIDFSPIDFFFLSAPYIYYDPYHIYCPSLHLARLMAVA